MSVVWVFPGQGSQSVGMGRDLYALFPVARETFDEADAILGFPLSRMCFEGPEDLLTATEHAQPALLTVSVALMRAMVHLDVHQQLDSPQMVAGHSLGEYTALVAGGSLDFATALRLVRRRGELMAAAHEGTMAAVMGLDAHVLDQICKEVTQTPLDGTGTSWEVVIANYNAPGQLVISGGVGAVEQASALAKQQGAKRVIPLKVSAAFHSPLMRDVATAMAQAIAAASVQDVQIPLITNVHAHPITTAADVRQELIAQIASPVRWIASVERMVAMGASSVVEIGSGKVLAGLIKRIAPSLQTTSLGTADEVQRFVAVS